MNRTALSRMLAHTDTPKAAVATTAPYQAAQSDAFIAAIMMRRDRRANGATSGCRWYHPARSIARRLTSGRRTHRRTSNERDESEEAVHLAARVVPSRSRDEDVR